MGRTYLTTFPCHSRLLQERQQDLSFYDRSLAERVDLANRKTFYKPGRIERSNIDWKRTDALRKEVIPSLPSSPDRRYVFNPKTHMIEIVRNGDGHVRERKCYNSEGFKSIGFGREKIA